VNKFHRLAAPKLLQKSFSPLVEWDEVGSPDFVLSVDLLDNQLSVPLESDMGGLEEESCLCRQNKSLIFCHIVGGLYP
jgi:hypothetical protein